MKVEKEEFWHSGVRLRLSHSIFKPGYGVRILRIRFVSIHKTVFRHVLAKKCIEYYYGLYAKINRKRT
jgi:hypothetical protein